MFSGEREIVTALDIGSSKIFTIVAEKKGDTIGEIIGVAITSSQGIRHGIIVDIDKTVSAIKQVLTEAERMSGVNINSVFVNVTGSHISSINKRKVVSVLGENHEITSKDVARVTDVNELISVPSSKEIIHVLPSEFIVDGCKGIKSPLGMSGMIIEAKSHIVLGDKAAIKNLVKCVSQSGVEIESLVFQALANAEAVLTNSEKRLGVVLVDIGAGITDVSIYKDSSIKYNTVLEFGGDNITSDLARELRISQKDAEKLKRNYGCAFSKSTSAISDIEFITTKGEKILIPEKKAAKIIERRISEIFKAVNRKIIKSGHKDLLPAGIVITGGEALLSNLSETASKVLSLPTRLGIPNRFDDLARFFVGENSIGNKKKGVIFSTGLGLLEYGSKKQEDKKDLTKAFKNKQFKKQQSDSKKSPGLWAKIKNVINSFF